MKIFIALFGWYGAFAILSAYAMVSFGILAASDFVFQLLNLTGALGIVVVSFYKHTYQPGVLNLIWSIIALVAIIQLLLR